MGTSSWKGELVLMTQLKTGRVDQAPQPSCLQRDGRHFKRIHSLSAADAPGLPVLVESSVIWA